MDQNYISNMSKSEHDLHINDINNHIMELGKENRKLNMTNKNIIDMINLVNSDKTYKSDEKATLLQHLKLSLKTNNGILGENIKNTGDMLNTQELNLKNLETNEAYIGYLKKIVENRQKESDVEYDTLKRDLDTKKRIKEMNTYYEKKYKRQMEVARNVSYLAITIVIIVIIQNNIPMGEFMFAVIIGILIAVLIIYLIYSIFDIYLRNNMRFDEYDFWTYDKKDKNVIKPSYNNLHLKNDEKKCW